MAQLAAVSRADRAHTRTLARPTRTPPPSVGPHRRYQPRQHINSKARRSTGTCPSTASWRCSRMTSVNVVVSYAARPKHSSLPARRVLLAWGMDLCVPVKSVLCTAAVPCTLVISTAESGGALCRLRNRQSSGCIIGLFVNLIIIVVVVVSSRRGLGGCAKHNTRVQ